jgi:ribonucleoside-diphosphate reductase alpha chain
MIELTRENLRKELSEEDQFSLKIMADRYMLKDSESKPLINSAVVVELEVVDQEGNTQYDENGHVRTIKEVGIVTATLGDFLYEVTLFTGERGKTFEVEKKQLDVLLETDPAQMKKRIAGALSGGDPKLEKDIEEQVLEQIVFGGRILAGAGTDEELTYFNCYVAPMIHDSRGGIAEHRKIVMEIMSRGGGVGTNGSTLRPSKTKVHKVRGRSSGAVSWLADLANLTHLVEQGGSRRGAQMIALADFHPDIIEFITAKAQKPLKAEITINGKKKTIKFGKRGNQRLTGANISVLVSDSLMEKAKKGEDWELRFPDVANYTPAEMEIYDEVWHTIGDPDKFHEETGLAIKTHAVIPARDLINLIGVASHGSAEPGTLFLERANKFSNTWYFNPLICTNPCGEQFLSAWSVCNLGHINLAKLVKWNAEKGRFEVDWDGLKRTTRILTRALDNVIDATPYYFQVNEDNQKGERRLGLGTMGIDEMLKLCGYDYGTQEGRDFASEVFKQITLTAYDTSVNIAIEKEPFPNFHAEKFLQSGFMKFLAQEDPKLIEKIKMYGIRNATIITQAPTGTTGTMAQTSTGIEPFYAGTFFRSSRIGFTTQTAPVIKRMENAGMDTSELKYAGDYTTKEHLDFQAVAQLWCDSSISKTINAPSTATVEDVTGLMEYAYEIGLKGFTVYVDGSREIQVLSTEETPSEEAEKVSEPFKRDSVLAGRTHQVETSYGRLYVTFNRDADGHLREVFFNIGKAGSDVLATLEGYGRLLSLMLQNSEIPEEDIIKQLSGIVGSNPYGFGEKKVLSIPDAIAVAFKRELSVKTPEKTIEVENKDVCSCGAPMMMIEGCMSCQACGNAKCG